MNLKSEFIEKAKENLNAAELLFDNKLYNASANRSYYSAFHAAISALSKEGFETERISHEAAQSSYVNLYELNAKKLFNRLINPKISATYPCSKFISCISCYVLYYIR